VKLSAPPWIAGHRGAAAEALENTLSSFALAVAGGADLIELDVQLTFDGVLAVLHDPTYARVAGSTLSPERQSWTALGALRLHDGSAPAELGAVFESLPAGYPVNVELKRFAAPIERLAAAAARLAGRPNTLVSSFDWPLLQAVRALAPQLALAPIAGDDAAIEPLRSVAARLGAWSIHIARGLAPRALATLAGDRRPVLCFTVNDPGEARHLLDSGASGVFSDSPGALRRALGLSASGSIRMLDSSP
jgi:glycerophosphoryl diester phosphodiesterase